MRVLVIEDDQVMAASLGLLLKREGIEMITTELGAEGIACAATGSVDLVILDLGLADMTGFEVLQALRSTNVNTPVLVLSGDAVVQSRVRALRLGADDFVVKPFHRDELLARVRAIARRSQLPSRNTITVGNVVLNLDDKRVTASGVPLNLTVKEYMILEAMAVRKGVTLTKSAFLHYLYDGRDEPSHKIIDVFVCKLRRKILEAGGSDCIRTVWGQGYALDDPSTDSAVAA